MCSADSMSDSILANVVSCGIHAYLWQYFMSDAIVVWRAWVLWEGNVRIRVLLSLCLFGSLGNSQFTRISPTLRGSTDILPSPVTIEATVDNLGYEIITNMLPQLSAIYPVIIILLVALEKTHLEYTMTSAVSQPINFGHTMNLTTSTTGPIHLRAGLQTSGTNIDGMKEKGKPALHPTSSVDFVSRGESPQ
ncbi:hypothetical protein B0H14DRAFT_3716257 [Mycena olivaceomarginata]|nr:hypothetical protein B0H14DRAFT_3716257 [Mycena olivaceomarginata]